MKFLLEMLGRLSRSVRLVLGLVLVVGGLTTLLLFAWCRVYVPPGYSVVWVAKSGAALPAQQELAETGQKGIQRVTSGPGRYFYNPLTWDAQLVQMVEIKSGNPATWTWVHTAHRLPYGGQVGPGGNIIAGEFPEIGILTRKTGKPHPQGDAVVPMNSEYKGIIAEVLTPGLYRVNPYEYEVNKVPALVIPAGFVGVVTNQLGEQPAMVEVPDATAPIPSTQPVDPANQPKKWIRPLAEGNQRGTLRNVLTPGIYYLNPNVVRVRITEVGFNEFTQAAGHGMTDTIRFPSKSGFDIELGVTVVWGLDPRHAAQVVNEFGNTTEILEKVIKPQLRSICRNQGSLYEARDFIQGEKREEFQHVLTKNLHEVCAGKNIELMLALISTIEVYSREGQAAEGEADLKTEIQDSFIAIERQLTNVKLQETAKKKALLEQARKTVDVTRETIQAQTRKRVAEIMADGQRKAAEIEAQGRLTVASIDRDIALLEAQKTELLGKAAAEADRMKRQAESDGRRMLIEALGSGAAYNLYTFAKEFQPESIRLIYSGEGTFWTDLKRIEEIGAAKIVREDKAKSTGSR